MSHQPVQPNPCQCRICNAASTGNRTRGTPMATMLSATRPPARRTATPPHRPSPSDPPATRHPPPDRPTTRPTALPPTRNPRKPDRPTGRATTRRLLPPARPAHRTGAGLRDAYMPRDNAPMAKGVQRKRPSLMQRNYDAQVLMNSGECSWCTPFHCVTKANFGKSCPAPFAEIRVLSADPSPFGGATTLPRDRCSAHLPCGHKTSGRGGASEGASATSDASRVRNSAQS